MYESTCKTIESLNLIKIGTFDQNQFMACYLIFNFRPTYFSYFRKIIALSISHNVKKTTGPKVVLPRSQNILTASSFIWFCGSKHAPIDDFSLQVSTISQIYWSNVFCKHFFYKKRKNRRIMQIWNKFDFNFELELGSVGL